MKSLKEYILEHTVDVKESKQCSEETKEFTFNFDGIENGEEIAKSFAEKDYASVDGNSVTLTVCKGNECENCKEMKEKISEIRGAQKNKSDESYAQKTKKLEDLMNEVSEYTKKEEKNEEE